MLYGSVMFVVRLLFDVHFDCISFPLFAIWCICCSTSFDTEINQTQRTNVVEKCCWSRMICAAVPAGAPLNFTAIGMSSTSVRLQWQPPARQHRNGEIILYELLYHDRRDPADDWPTNTTETSIVIDGLQPTTYYVFHIRAYTSKGAGPWSSQLLFRTTNVLRECC